MVAVNGVAWFEVGTDDPAGAERFYGDVFGWSVARDETKSTDPVYQVFTTGNGEGLRGGLFDTKGAVSNYAVFAVQVEDVPLACQRAEEAGGKVVRAPQVNPAGVGFAHLLDPAGNHFAVFTTSSAQS